MEPAGPDDYGGKIVGEDSWGAGEQANNGSADQTAEEVAGMNVSTKDFIMRVAFVAALVLGVLSFIKTYAWILIPLGVLIGSLFIYVKFKDLQSQKADPLNATEDSTWESQDYENSLSEADLFNDYEQYVENYYNYNRDWDDVDEIN